MSKPQNPFEDPPDVHPHPRFTTLPEQVFVRSGLLDAAPPSRATPKPRPTVDLLKDISTNTVPIFAGDKGHLLRPYVRSILNITVLRAGITPTEGVDQDLPHNSVQLKASANSLVEAGHEHPQVSALVADDVFTTVPGLVTEAEVREALLEDAELYVKHLKRGLVATYNKIDSKIRPYMSVLRPLESRPGIGIALKPYYALTQDPADKAQQTLRTFNEGVEEGVERGRAQGQAEAKKAAPRAATPATQVNIAGSNPDAPASEPEPPTQTRKRPR